MYRECLLTELRIENMDVKKEQQAAILFCVRLKKQPAETYALLQQAYGAQCLSRTMVKRWHKLYFKGHTKVGVVPRGSIKRKMATEVNVNTVATAIQEDRQLSTRKLESMLNISKSTIHSILSEDLGMRLVELLISYHFGISLFDRGTRYAL